MADWPLGGRDLDALRGLSTRVGETVRFTIVSGGGKLSGAEPDPDGSVAAAAAAVPVTEGDDGLARVWWVVGPAADPAVAPDTFDPDCAQLVRAELVGPGDTSPAPAAGVVSTDDTGVARLQWTLGTEQGLPVQRVSATLLDGTDRQSLLYTAHLAMASEVSWNPCRRLVKAAGENPTVQVALDLFCELLGSIGGSGEVLLLGGMRPIRSPASAVLGGRATSALSGGPAFPMGHGAGPTADTARGRRDSGRVGTGHDHSGGGADQSPRAPSPARRDGRDAGQAPPPRPARGAPVSAAAVLRLQRLAGNSALATTLRSVPGRVASALQREESRSAAAGGLIVEDGVAAGPGQLARTAFLAELRRAVTVTADQALAPVGRTAADCPYIERAFTEYGSRSAADLEKALREYAPAAAGAKAARDYLPHVTARVRSGVLTWAGRGERDGGATGLVQAGGAVGGAVSGALARAAATLGGLLFSRLPGRAPAGHPAAVRARLGEGRPLEGSVRGRMETALRGDLGSVRVHDDGAAAGVADELNARAFTVGSDVGFGSGRYRPGTPVGDALLAHELAHVMQQGAAGPAVARQPAELPGHDEVATEGDADRTAASAVAALWGNGTAAAREVAGNAGPAVRSGLALRRCGGLSDAQEKKFLDQARARASGDLDKQLATTRDELLQLESAGEQIRADAVAKKLVPQEVITPWGQAYGAILAMQPKVSSGILDEGHKKDAATALQRFYDEFRKVVARYDYTVQGQGRGAATLTKNPYLSDDQLRGRSYPLNMDSVGMLKRLHDASAAGDWPAVVRDFHTASNGLDGYISMQLRTLAKVEEGKALGAKEAAGGEPIGKLEVALTAGSADAAVAEPAKKAMLDFAQTLRSTVAHADYVHKVEPKAVRSTSPYLAVTNDFLTQDDLEQFRDRATRATSAADLRALLGRYGELKKARDRYLADPKVLGSSADADKLERAGKLSRGIDELRTEHPDAQKIRAVFYAEPGEKDVDAPGYTTPPPVPIELFLFKDGGKWKLRDLTSTLEPKENEESAEEGKPAPLPALMRHLDSKLRFPKGLVSWRAPDGQAGEQRTTEARSFSEWLTLAGIVLAAVGLALATAGASTAATGFIIASSLTGAVAAAAAMGEKSEQGMLTTVDVVVGLAQIAADITTAYTAGAGKLIISQAGKTGTFARIAVLADRYYAVTSKITLGANALTFITFNVQAAEDLKKIDTGPGSSDEKALAKERLMQQMLLMGAVTLLGVHGELKDFRAGRSIYLDPDFAKGGMARQMFANEEILAKAARYGETDGLKALLENKKLPEELGFKLNAELADALSKAKIPEEGMRLVLGRLTAGSTAAEVEAVVTEVRRANRLVYADVLGADGRIVMEEVGGRLRARPVLGEADLLARAKKLGTGDVLQQVLARTDLPAALKDGIRQELSIGIATGQLDDTGLAKTIGALKKAEGATQAQEALAELVHGNAVASTLRSDAKVVTGAKIGKEYTFGGKTVKIDPMSELDVLYLGNDAKIHADEVKNTTNALRQKLDVTPAQLANMQNWRAAEPGGRVVSVVIHSEERWTDLFRPVGKDGPATMQQLIDGGIPLRIAGREWSPAKMQQIWDTVLAKGSVGGKPPTPDFFKSISNFTDAQKVLGISL